MPTKKEVLAQRTFDDVPEIEKRVYYTLTQDPKMTAHCTAKAVGILFQRLHAKKLITKSDIDSILLECAT